MSYLPQRLPELITSEVLHSREEQEWVGEEGGKNQKRNRKIKKGKFFKKEEIYLHQRETLKKKK